MARIIRSRAPLSGRTHWWSTLAVGAAVGAVVAWLLLNDDDEHADGPAPRRRPRGARGPLDLDGMNARLRALPGAGALRLRSLGDGLLELVGSATADLDVTALLATLAAEPGVSVVVNRVWTPASAGDPPPHGDPLRPADPDEAPPSPRTAP